MKNLDDLMDDINWFLANIEDGDKYLDGDPNKEFGLQYDLYQYLKETGYLVVYELELPELQKYLAQELNGGRVFGFIEGSLRPDLVVDLGLYGLVCIELKYNETDKNEIHEDAAKSRVYVKHCSDVHLACHIHLHRHNINHEGYDSTPCLDGNYRYSFYYYTDNPKSGIKKAPNAYPIKSLWLRQSQEIADGGGKFADYE